jgi:hypothetical protein
MNNWDVWVEMEDNPNKDGSFKDMKQLVNKQRYMVDGPGRKHSWSTSGRDFYNDMFAAIESDRTKNGKEFNIAFLQHMQGATNTETIDRRAKRNHGKSNVGEKRVVRCRHSAIPLKVGATETA